MNFISTWPANINGHSFPAPTPRGDYNSVHDAHVAALHDSRYGVRGVVGRADSKIQAFGWAQHVSPFWELRWMRPSFYRCFAICLLHLEYLGLAKVRKSPAMLYLNSQPLTFFLQQRHLIYTAIKNNLYDELNKRFKSFQRFPGISSFLNCINLLRHSDKVCILFAYTVLLLTTTCAGLALLGLAEGR
jgi:hypothetical protein